MAPPSTSRRSTSRAAAPSHPRPALEALEPRVLLAASPMPDLADLQDPAHTVIRIETTLGAVDVELFDGVASGSVADFLARVGRGDLDRTLFNRLHTGVALEAGAYTHDPIAGVRPAPADVAHAGVAISNLSRTVAVPVGEGAGLRFNLDHGAAQADGAWTVVGRIVNEESWAVLQDIAALPTADLRVVLPGAANSTLDAAPTIDNAPVRIVDAEVIKAAGAGEFFTQSIAYPEGFSGSTVDEFVPIVNPNDQAVTYQVILRFERDPADPFAKRDAVVATGTVAGHSRSGVTVWTGAADFPAATADSLITPGRPYAIEVRSTLPLAATLSHYDFGSATGEGFVAQPETAWALTGGVKAEGVHDFLVWYNTTGGEAAVTVTIYPDGHAPLAPITISTEAYRRGGLDMASLAALPDGPFAALITSDQPIIAALSHYHPSGPIEGYTGLGARGAAATSGVIPLASFGDTPDAASPTLSFINPAQASNDDDELPAFVTICHLPPGNPDNVQIITIPRAALAAHLAHGDVLWSDEHGCACGEHGHGHEVPGGGQGHDEHGNGRGHGHEHHGHSEREDCPPPETPAAVITLTLRFEDETIPDLVLPDALTLAPGRAGRVRLDSVIGDMTPYQGQRFTVMYASTLPVYAGVSATDGFDGVSTEVGSRAATRTLFAEGFSDPARAGADIFETIAVYNPDSDADETATVTVAFMYTDGAVVEIQRVLVAGRTLFLDVHFLQEILDQGEENHRYFYSIEVLASAPVLAQLVHLDTNLGRDGNAAGGFTTMGMPMEFAAI